MKSTRLVVSAAVMIGAALPAVCDAVGYTFTDIGLNVPAGSTGSVATSISPTGEVVGYYKTGTGGSTTVSGFSYSATGVYAALPSDAGPSYYGYQSTPAAVNASGVIVDANGTYYTPAAGQYAAVPPAPSATDLYSAAAVNTAGMIVGQEQVYYNFGNGTGTNVSHGYVYNPATKTTTDLDNTALGGTGSSPASATGINTAGQVVGSMFATGSVNSAFIATPTGSGGYTYVNVGTAVANSASNVAASGANGVNDSGEVVGYWYTASDIPQAFAYLGGPQAIILGNLGGSGSYTVNTEALAVNNQGLIVGYSATTGNAAEHAFIYENGAMFDLNNLVNLPAGYVLNTATSINDAGDIVGTATDNGVSTAYELQVIAAPEPTSAALLSAATAGLLLGFRRRRRGITAG